VSGSRKVAKLLAERGADVDARDEQGWTLLHEAAEADNPKSAAILLSLGADVNARLRDESAQIADATPLHMAAQNNYKEVAEILLRYGADISARCQTGESPLHIAAMHGSKEVAEVLLAHGANVNIQVPHPSLFTARLPDGKLFERRVCRTPLDYAIVHGETQMAEFLRRHGAK